MKNGILFFFYMGRISTAARLLFFPFLSLIWQARPYSFGFWVYVSLTVLALAFSMIHSPSDRAMMSVLEHFRQEVRHQMKKLCQIRDDEYYVVLEGYRQKGAMRLYRQIGTELVYPHPITVVFAEKESRRCLIIAEKSLLTSAPAKIETIAIHNATLAQSIRVETQADEENDKVVSLTIYVKDDPNGITLFAKNDYHYRDFMAAVRRIKKEEN